MQAVCQLHCHFDDIQAHSDDVLAGGAVVPGAHVAFEGILQARGAVYGHASGGDDVQCVGVQVVVMRCLLVVQ